LLRPSGRETSDQKEPEPVSSLSADARQPFMPCVASLERLPSSLIPSVRRARRMRPLSVGASGTLHPSTDQHTMVPIFCKEISTEGFLTKDGAGAHRAGYGWRAPSPSPDLIRGSSRAISAVRRIETSQASLRGKSFPSISLWHGRAMPNASLRRRGVDGPQATP